jgi:hypothetical protein
MVNLSVFCRTNSPFTDQSRPEGNNTECVGKKRFNGRVLPPGFVKEHVPLFKHLSRDDEKTTITAMYHWR